VSKWIDWLSARSQVVATAIFTVLAFIAATIWKFWPSAWASMAAATAPARAWLGSFFTIPVPLWLTLLLMLGAAGGFPLSSADA